jgi:hypothetical protein
VSALIYLSDDPPREVDYATHLLGVRPTHVAPDQVRFDTPRGEALEFLSHARLIERFGGLAPAPCASQPVLGVGLRLQVADLGACDSLLTRNGLPTLRLDGRIVVPASSAGGVLLEFHA